jgi:hypothetical protein
MHMNEAKEGVAARLMPPTTRKRPRSERLEGHRKPLALLRARPPMEAASHSQYTRTAKRE